MGVFQKFVWFFDSFPAPAGLRSHGEPEFSSACTGIFSILLVIGFAYVFFAKAYEVFTYQSIDFKSVVEDGVDKQKEG